MIKYIAFDLDDTLFNGTSLVEKTRKASIQMMIEYGLPVDEEYALKVLYEIVEEFGSNDENHLDNLMIRLQNDPNIRLDKKYNVNKFVAAGIMGYHREKVRHLKPFRDVTKSFHKFHQLGLKIAIVTDGKPKKQYEKILRLKIEKYLDHVIISDEVAVRKPNSLLFRFMLDQIGCKPNEVIYIGDRLEKDILPAKEAGIYTVLIHRGTKYDPFISKKEIKIEPDYHANDLYEILKIIDDIHSKEQIAQP